MLRVGMVLAVVLGMMATTATPAPAASTGTFAAQAAATGLSRVQAKALQLRVDGYLATWGGTQTAANEIVHPGGAALVLALPGEQTARRLGTTLREPQGCPYYYMCSYRYQNLQGDAILAYFCNSPVSIPWVGYGSWVNNQTAGTRAYFLDNSWHVIGTTPPAYSRSYSHYWTPVRAVDAC